MPAGRLLRALRPVGRPRRRLQSSYGGGRLHSSYTRAGKAVQPQARPDGTKEEADTEPTPRDVDPATEEDPVPEPEPEPTPDTPDPARAEEAKDGAPESAGEGKQESEGKQPEGEGKDDEPGPMEVLYMREPTVVPGKNHPPMPYTHYFDTYLMVNRLTSAGFKKGGGVTTMKAVRALLGAKMEEAQGRLVSKGDVDNETYLFQAACSELSTEVRNNRRATDEVMREQRMRLQHDADVTGQTLNHELLTLNDTVRGLFDDRKMAVREEQKANAGSIQKINYKIGTMLSSDTKSDIEGLRWVIIRRSALGIAFMAVATLATLRYASYVNQQRKEEAARAKQEAEEEKRRELGEAA